MNQTPVIEPTLEMLAGQPVGRRCRIHSLSLSQEFRQRLLEMGISPGSECRVVRYAPLGDPMEIAVRGYSLALRLSEAQGVRIHKA